MALTEIGARLRLVGAAGYKRDADKAADATGRLGKAGDKAARGLGSLDRAVSSGLRAGLRGVGGAGKLAAVGIGVAAVAATALSFKFLALATDAGETESKFLTVFGKAAVGVGKFNTDISNRFGMTTKSLQDATSTFGVYGQGANLAGKELVKFSTGLVQAGLDLGSFYNASAEEVFGAIQSGLSGEAEPLRRYAIFLSDINLQAFAASIGIRKSMKSMTEQQKVALRGRFIMAKLGKAEGDLAKTSGGLANQQRALSGRLEESGTIIGKALLPGATKAATILNKRLAPAMTRLRDLAPQTEKKFTGLVDTVFKFGDSMLLAAKRGGPKEMLAELDKLTGSGGKLVTRVEDIKKVLKEVAWPTAERLARVFGKAMELAAEHTTTAYVALGLFLARAKLLLAASLAAKGYAIACGLVAAAQGRVLVATTAATGGIVVQTLAVRANTVALGLMGTAAGAALATFGALGFAAATAYGLTKWISAAETSKSNRGSTQAGMPTATIGKSNGYDSRGQPIIVPRAAPPKPPGSSGDRPIRPASVNRTTVVIPVQMDGRTVGTAVLEDFEDRVARR